MFLSSKASRTRLREAENARRNRLEILKALSHGQVTRRELLKWGLFTGAGVLAFKNGLSPFVASALARSNIPTGVPLVYELDDALKPIRHYYLGDPAEVEKATLTVASQGKAKA